MNRFVAMSPTQDELLRYEVRINLPEGEITELERMVSHTRSAEGTMTAPFRAKSSFSIGNPRIFSLIPDECSIAQLYCTFLPAKGCRFSDAKFEIALITTPTVSNSPSISPKKAIALDLSPRLIDDSCTINREYSVTPDLKFNFGLLQVSITPSNKRVENFISYTNRINAYGLNASTAGWCFKRTFAHEIEGIQELFMIIGKPRSSQVTAKLSLTANLEVITDIGVFGPFSLLSTLFVKGNDSPITDEQPILLC